MIQGGRTILRMALVAVVMIALWTVVGCQSESRTTSTETQSVSGDKEHHSDAMLDSDTERAKAAMREGSGDSRPRKPAMSGRRDGTRSVDQPRVGP